MFCKDSSGRAAAAGASRGADGGKSCSRPRPAGRPGSRGARGPEPRPVDPPPPPRSQLNRYGARCLPRASPLHEPSPEAGIFWQVRPPHHCNISLPNRGLCHCAALRPSMAPPCHWRQLGLLYLASKALQDPELASPSLPATPEPRPLPAALPLSSPPGCFRPSSSPILLKGPASILPLRGAFRMAPAHTGSPPLSPMPPIKSEKYLSPGVWRMVSGDQPIIEQSFLRQRFPYTAPSVYTASPK